MPTAARLKLEFEEGLCPHCRAPLQLQFGAARQPRPRDLVESTGCPECGQQIVCETRGSRFWWTPDEFAGKETPARRLIQSSRQWFGLAVELHLAAVEVMGGESGGIARDLERADALLRRALAPALDRARDEVAEGQ